MTYPHEPTCSPDSWYLLFLLFLFGWIERKWPAVLSRQKFLTRKQTFTDICYWFFNPIVTKAITTFCAGMVIFSVTRLFGLDVDQVKLHGFGPIASQPMPLIILEMLILGDLVGYWIHRAFHQIEDLWDIHAIHHSSVELNWLSSVRVHPLNNILSKTLRIVPFLFLGFPLTALAAYLPILILFAIFLHANVPWQFSGRIKYFIATPTYHRWHHASLQSPDVQGQSCNYAGLFPFIDWFFGTLYLPTAIPTSFGVKEKTPDSFLGQLIYPFSPDRGETETVTKNSVPPTASV